MRKFSILCNGFPVTLSEAQKNAISSMSSDEVLIFGKSDFPDINQQAIHPNHFAIYKTKDGSYNLYGVSEGIYATSVCIL